MCEPFHGDKPLRRELTRRLELELLIIKIHKKEIPLRGAPEEVCTGRIPETDDSRVSAQGRFVNHQSLVSAYGGGILPPLLLTALRRYGSAKMRDEINDRPNREKKLTTDPPFLFSLIFLWADLSLGSSPHAPDG